MSSARSIYGCYLMNLYKRLIWLREQYRFLGNLKGFESCRPRLYITKFVNMRGPGTFFGNAEGHQEVPKVNVQ